MLHIYTYLQLFYYHTAYTALQLQGIGVLGARYQWEGWLEDPRLGKLLPRLARIGLFSCLPWSLRKNILMGFR